MATAEARLSSPFSRRRHAFTPSVIRCRHADEIPPQGLSGSGNGRFDAARAMMASIYLRGGARQLGADALNGLIPEGWMRIEFVAERGFFGRSCRSTFLEVDRTLMRRWPHCREIFHAHDAGQAFHEVVTSMSISCTMIFTRVLPPPILGGIESPTISR